MKTKFLIMAQVMAAVGMDANAAHVLDDTWFETQLKTTIPKGIDWTNNITVKSLQGDSGKGNCYSHVIYANDINDTNRYNVNTVCKTAGKWGITSTSTLHDVDDGAAIGETGFSLWLPVNGTSPWNGSLYQELRVEDATIILTPKINNNELKSVTLTTKTQGAILYSDSDTGIEGSDKLKGFTFKYKDTSSVPDDAKLCVITYYEAQDNSPPSPYENCAF